MLFRALCEIISGLVENPFRKGKSACPRAVYDTCPVGGKW